jgi:hypothetical protein
MSKRNPASSRKQTQEQDNIEIDPVILALLKDLRKFYTDMIEQLPSDPIAQKLAREGLEITDDVMAAAIMPGNIFGPDAA